MSGTVSAIKTLIVPAVISLLIFLIITFVLVPTWRRYRNRYSQYLPLDSISSQTDSLRHRLYTRVVRFFLPSTWRMDRDVVFATSAQGGYLSTDDSDEGEELGAVNEDARQEAQRRALSGRPDNARRLSRDLEEGFMDDSDDDD